MVTGGLDALPKSFLWRALRFGAPIAERSPRPEDGPASASPRPDTSVLIVVSSRFTTVYGGECRWTTC